MSDRADQEWSLHAQLTISHGNEEVPRPVPHPCYGFQRGNITFTTKPPSDNVPRRTPQPYGRRCMSTYNIKLDPTETHATAHARCHHTVTLTCEPRDECDVCSGGRQSPSAARRAHTFTSHFCTRVPDKTVGTKTVASQTSQVFSPSQGPSKTLDVPGFAEKQTQSGQKKLHKKLSRSPARVRGKSPLMSKTSSEGKKKQPRTVHIDVYCTASEASDSSDTEEDPSESSRKTVYESKDVRIVHTREQERLPQALCRQKRRTLSEASTSHSCIGGLESCDTNVSSLYPSQRSSFASGLSMPMSLQTEDSSMVSSVTSSCAIFSEDLITSCKDSSDVDSMRRTDLSLARTESFEYEDDLDRWRIMQKEMAWGGGEKSWCSPEKEHRHRLQQKRHQQYMERKGSPFPQWDPNDEDEGEESSSGSSDTSSEMAWSFGNVSDKMKHVKREDTVRKASRDAIYPKKESKNRAYKILESGSLSDSAAPSPVHHRFQVRDSIGPFGVKESSPPKAKLESTITTPFTSVPGKKTDQLSKAEKFGTIIGTLRKPGHHVGPSKNPDCSCYNCRQFYEEMGYRNRTRSLGDTPSTIERDKWRATLGSLIQKRPNEDSGSAEWDMGTPV